MLIRAGTALAGPIGRDQRHLLASPVSDVLKSRLPCVIGVQADWKSVSAIVVSSGAVDVAVPILARAEREMV